MKENDHVIESEEVNKNNDDLEDSTVDKNIESQYLKNNTDTDVLFKSGFMAKGSFFREWIIPVIAAIGIAILINKFLIYNVYIPSESMVPTLNVGDKLMVTKIYNTDKIKRGDIIVFYSEELSERLIKRAIGLPGDHIEIHDGIVNVDGEDIKEDYVKNNEDVDKIYDVPQGKFFFLGDNRNGSYDARKWINPYIDESDIQGKAIIKFYPFKDFGSLK